MATSKYCTLELCGGHVYIGKPVEIVYRNHIHVG